MEDAIMSTRSELYHCFGLGVVEVSRTEFGGGETVFYCQTPASRLRCACCYGTDVICRGNATTIEAVPAAHPKPNSRFGVIPMLMIRRPIITETTSMPVSGHNATNPQRERNAVLRPSLRSGVSHRATVIVATATATRTQENVNLKRTARLNE